MARRDESAATGLRACGSFREGVAGNRHSRRGAALRVLAAIAADRGAGLLRSFVLFGALLLTGACQPAEPPLRVGLPARVPAEFAFLARDAGFFDDREIELVQYDSALELSRHFREGLLDAAALTLDFVPYWSAAIPSLSVVFVSDVSRGADGVVSVPEIADLASLRGKRIGVEASPLAAHLLLRMLKAGGLHARDVESVLVEAEEQAEAFRSRRVDAVVTSEPERTRLLAAGGSSLFDSAQIPGQVVSVLVTPAGIAVERAAELRKLIEGWLSAYAHLQSDRTGTVARLAGGLALDGTAVERALGGTQLGDLAFNRELLGGTKPRIGTTLEEIESMALSAGLLRADQRRSVRSDDTLLPPMISRPIGDIRGELARPGTGTR